MFSSRRPRQSFVPHLERLNDRIVPAGNITTGFAQGVLTITGDANNQRIALLGGSEGHVSISHLDGETRTGRNSFNNVRTVVLNMNAGDDTVVIANVRLGRFGSSLRYAGGDGNNQLLYDGQKNYLESLVASNGTAADGSFTMSPVALDLAHKVKIIFGSVDINCPTSTNNIVLFNTTVIRTTRIVTGSLANDTVQIDNSTFQSRFTLLTGGGDDSVEIGLIPFGASDGVPVIFASSVTMNLGTGNDNLTAGVSYRDVESPDLVRFLGRQVILDGGADPGATDVDILQVHHPRATEFVADGDPTCDNWENIVFVL